jgi:hypothetical protein
VRVLADARARVLTLGRRGCAGGERPLLMAAKVGRYDLMQLLADFQAQVDDKALILASEAGHLAAVRLLLKLGADVKVTEQEQGNCGRTCLHRASKRGHAAVVKTLLEHGADVTARDTQVVVVSSKGLNSTSAGRRCASVPYLCWCVYGRQGAPRGRASTVVEALLVAVAPPLTARLLSSTGGPASTKPPIAGTLRW